MRPPAALLAAAVLTIALLAGCSGSAGSSGSADPGGSAGAAGPSGKPPAGGPPPFADCAALTSPPVPAGGAVSPGSATAPAAAAPAVPATPAAAPATVAPATPAGAALPDLPLPCFTGDRTVDIGQIRGPALINLWASWCAPCREELPAFQRLATRAGDRMHVLGVVSSDDRAAAQSLAEELGVTFPAVYDRQSALRTRLAKAGLPVTVFVDAGGRISHVYNSRPLDDGALARLVERYIAVEVPA